MTSPVYVILGPGGQGRDVIDAPTAAGRTVAGAFDDDNPPRPAMVQRRRHRGVPLLGGLDSWRSKLAAGVEFMPAMGNPTQRAELAAAIVIGGGRLASAIHPAAVVSPRASVGPGVFLGAGVVVAPEAVIGDLTFLNALCSVDHDCQLGTAVQVSPGVILPGGVHIGDSAFIGAGAVVLPGRHIGAGAVVGAGSVVIHDVPEGVTVAGNPAREIKRS